MEALLRGADPAAIEHRDEQEVAGYAEVLDLIIARWTTIPVTANSIRQLHRLMMTYRARDGWHRGKFKTVPNHVAAVDRFGRPVGVILRTAEPYETSERMEALTAWYAREADAGDLHPLLCIGVFVVVFLQIHPFQDGNGRLSRLLTLLLVLRAGYSHAPYASLERLIERRREAYYRTLRQTQGTLDLEHPDWTPWLTFFVEVLHAQTRDLGRRLGTEQDLTALSADRAAILRHVQERGSATMRDLVLLTGLNRNTLKGHLRAWSTMASLSCTGPGGAAGTASPDARVRPRRTG